MPQVESLHVRIFGLIAQKGAGCDYPLNKPGGFGLPSVTGQRADHDQRRGRRARQLSAILAEHAGAIAYEVQPVLAIEFEQVAVM
jgi:hypothetical protein